jgi:dienelactone hydrolase
MCHPEIPAGTPEPMVRTREVTIDVGPGQSMPALLAVPDDTAPAPGVLIINDIFGRSPFYEHLARRLAQAGYVALDPEFFFREGPLADPSREAAFARRGTLQGTRTISDLEAALDWLKAAPECSGMTGTIGFCMGGTFVLNLAAVRADIAGAVAYYGFPKAQRVSPTEPPQPLDVADRMRGPILGHWGDQDSGVGMENVEALRGRLKAAGVKHEFHIYPGMGHGFLKAFLDDESQPGYEPACTSWKRTLQFYRGVFGRRQSSSA